MTGENLSEIVARRIAALICATVGFLSSSTSSAMPSSTSASDSMSAARVASAFSTSVGGIGSYSTFVPKSPLNRIARISTTSTTPASASSSPMGICINAALSRIFARSCETARSGFAPARSSLLMNVRRGTW
eukprot:Amastigsp_a340072_106.p4 type:complete len:132 gc:universal Amastigsp_a340072_106:924-529(-)